MILFASALMLLLLEGVWLYGRQTRAHAAMTYVGLDSVEVVVPAHTRAARLLAGKWDIDPLQPLSRKSVRNGLEAQENRLAFISLNPRPTFGAAISAIRTLKRQNVCNVVIREAGRLGHNTIQFDNGPDRPLAIDALVLCGGPIGDAGFSGTPHRTPSREANRRVDE